MFYKQGALAPRVAALVGFLAQHLQGVLDPDVFRPVVLSAYQMARPSRPLLIKLAAFNTA